MKKTLALILSLCMVFTLFAGCTGTSEEDAAKMDEINAILAEIGTDLTTLQEQKAALEAEAAAIEYSPYTADVDYDIIPVTMTMQAGFQEYRSYDSGFMTIHAGIGYIDPLGEGFYYAGIGYDEVAGNEEEIYVSDWMDANYGCGLFCVYSLPEGDIYTWDGIYGANAKDKSNYMSGEDGYTVEEVNGSIPTRGDVLINIVVGGTGAYKGATGVLIGSTSGGGVYDTQSGMTLPQTLFKLMEGYIKVPKNADATCTHTITQPFSENRAELEVRGTDYAMVDVELRMQTGSLEAENGGIGAGIGTFLPYNAGAMTSMLNNDQEAAKNYPVENYVNDNWLDVYGDPTFITFNLDDGNVAGDLYGWQFNYGYITDTSDPLTSTGSQSALFTIIVDGTGDFEGVTGILGGHTVVSDQEGWGIAEYDNDEPLCALTLMEGSLKVPADSDAAEYGNDIMTD